MSVLTREQILAKIRECVGEDTTDESIQLIEDITDTIDDFESKTKDTTDWKNKYKENDDMWRKKYKERFFCSPAKSEQDDSDSIDDESQNENKLTFENLFKEETK